MQVWQQEMRTLKIQHFRSISKEFYRLSGGDSMAVRLYSDVTAKGFIDCVVDYLAYHGYCTEVGSEVKGFTSIRANINGQKTLISVRVRKRKNRKGEPLTTPHIARPGEIHFVANDMDSFITWYKNNFSIHAGK
jgi:hypothetical protein